jgi:hypothetical protein
MKINAGAWGFEPETSCSEYIIWSILDQVIGLSYRHTSDPFCKLSLAYFSSSPISEDTGVDIKIIPSAFLINSLSSPRNYSMVVDIFDMNNHALNEKAKAQNLYFTR